MPKQKQGRNHGTRAAGSIAHAALAHVSPSGPPPSAGARCTAPPWSSPAAAAVPPALPAAGAHRKQSSMSMRCRSWPPSSWQAESWTACAAKLALGSTLSSMQPGTAECRLNRCRGGACPPRLPHLRCRHLAAGHHNRDLERRCRQLAPAKQHLAEAALLQRVPQLQRQMSRERVTGPVR